MEEIRSQTCVKFQNTNEKGARKIQEEDSGCWSNVGAQNGALNIPYGCEDSISHEILHSLGILHEQARTDRDVYLNVINKTDGNYNIDTRSSIVSPFEYASAMLYYPDKDFYPIDSNYYDSMGSRYLTFYDIYMVNKLYSCSCPKNLKCENQGYTNPSTCDKCICPDGFYGKLCNELKNTPIQSTLEWKTTIRKVTNETSYDYIKPMNGKTLEISVNNFSLNPYDNGCRDGGIEIKYLPDRRITNPLSCLGKYDIYKNIRTSSNDPTVIVYRSKSNGKSYQIRYRSV